MMFPKKGQGCQLEINLAMKVLIPIVLFLSIILFSCKNPSGIERGASDNSFYELWGKATLEEVRRCCAKDTLNILAQGIVKKLILQRAILFDTLLSETDLSQIYFVEEHFSEGNESAIYRMLIYSNSKKKIVEARVNYKGDVSINTTTYQRKKKFQHSTDCCPFTYLEFKIYKGHLPLKCSTFLNFKKDQSAIEVSLSFY